MEITLLDQLYCWLEQIEWEQQIMKEWPKYFTAKEHIEINELKKQVKRLIRRELNNAIRK